MPKAGGSDKNPASDDDRSHEAQSALDQAHHHAGGALTGREVRKRWGMDALDDPKDPPLDWRLTPRNVILQLLAVALFGGVVWFFFTLISDSLGALFG